MPKGVIKNYNVIINGKGFYDQFIDSDIKRYEKMKKKLNSRARWRLYYSMLIRFWIHQKSLQINSSWLSRQRELDADSKEIRQIEFVG